MIEDSDGRFGQRLPTSALYIDIWPGVIMTQSCTPVTWLGIDHGKGG